MRYPFLDRHHSRCSSPWLALVHHGCSLCSFFYHGAWRTGHRFVYVTWW
jgi:hypothetical protein